VKSTGASRWARGALASVSLSALLVATGGRAEAQSVYSWNGFYFGGSAGAAFGNSKNTTDAQCGTHGGGGIPDYFCGAPGQTPNATALSAAGTGSKSSVGFTGGGQIGYNWQFGTWVTGIESDFGAFGIRAKRTATGTYPIGGPGVTAGNIFTFNADTKTDWLWTLRARFGVTFSNALLYATGGLAASRVTFNTSYSDDSGTPATGAATSRAFKAGFVVGAGAEFKLTRNWSAKFEYLHVDLGSVSASTLLTGPNVVPGPGYSQAINTKADVTANVARVGINYQY
jgi:outer membrane immunogenic protein